MKLIYCNYDGKYAVMRGNYIAYISDASGEDEIYIVNQNDNERPTQLTFNTNIYKFSLKWSPDSKKIVWTDQNFKIHYIDINTKVVTEVASGKIYSYYSYYSRTIYL